MTKCESVVVRQQTVRHSEGGDIYEYGESKVSQHNDMPLRPWKCFILEKLCDTAYNEVTCPKAGVPNQSIARCV